MICYLNGRFLPEEQATVSIQDRCFRYGDGLFETVLIRNGRSFRWAAHWERFQKGAELLRIKLPLAGPDLEAVVAQLLEANHLKDALLRLQLSRGSGPRGYLPGGQELPLLLATVQTPPLPADRPWDLITASVVVAASDRLAQAKSCSRLASVLAAFEAHEAGCQEALWRNTDGHYCEGAASNLFWIQAGTVLTPPLSAGPLPGVTRGVVAELCSRLRVAHGERDARPEDLLSAEGVFLTQSSRGLVTAASLDGKALAVSPLIETLRQGWRELVAEECA